MTSCYYESEEQSPVHIARAQALRSASAKIPFHPSGNVLQYVQILKLKKRMRVAMKKIMVMLRVFIALLFLTTTGCAGMKLLPFTDDAKKYQAAIKLVEQRNYQAAHEAYRAIAETNSPWAEEAKYQAGSVLIANKNPAKRYAAAEREFEEFLSKYPESDLAGEAASWLAMLKMFHATKAGDLAREIESLNLRIAAYLKDLQKIQGEDELLRKEREALLTERTALLRKTVELLNEKTALIRKSEELARDNAGLTKDRIALTNQVHVLNKEKQKLVEQKASLEKSLRELTMVDIKMEKKRSRIKAEEKK
jgi:TolA-binding protein